MIRLARAQPNQDCNAACEGYNRVCEERAFFLASTEDQMKQLVQKFGIDCEHFPEGRWAGSPERSVQMMTRAVNCYYSPVDAKLRGLVDGSFGYLSD